MSEMDMPSDDAWASTSGSAARSTPRDGEVAGQRAHYVLRRFRRAIPARVRVEDGRPIHVTPQGLRGGPVIQAAGPWRTSGEWWKSPSRLQPETNPASSSAPLPVAAPSTASPPPAPRPRSSPLTESSDPDEWDVALSDGSLYRHPPRSPPQRWFAEAELDCLQADEARVRTRGASSGRS